MIEIIICCERSSIEIIMNSVCSILLLVSVFTLNTHGRFTEQTEIYHLKERIRIATELIQENCPQLLVEQEHVMRLKRALSHEFEFQFNARHLKEVMKVLSECSTLPKQCTSAATLNLTESWRKVGNVRNMPAAMADTDSHCGGTLEGMSGAITSPGHPGNYNASMNCTWRVTIPDGIIVLWIPVLDLESHATCAYDHLTVLDANSGNQLAKMCGSRNATKVEGTSNSVLINFKSDGSAQRAGFKLLWRSTTSDDIRDWFRFNGAAGDMLLNQCPPTGYSCGSRAPYWSDSSMPNIVGQSSNIMMYSSVWDSGEPLTNCKNSSVSATATRCSPVPGDFVYKINGQMPQPQSDHTICGMDAPQHGH